MELTQFGINIRVVNNINNSSFFLSFYALSIGKFTDDESPNNNTIMSVMNWCYLNEFNIKMMMEILIIYHLSKLDKKQIVTLNVKLSNPLYF